MSLPGASSLPFCRPLAAEEGTKSQSHLPGRPFGWWPPRTASGPRFLVPTDESQGPRHNRSWRSPQPGRRAKDGHLRDACGASAPGLSLLCRSFLLKEAPSLLRRLLRGDQGTEPTWEGRVPPAGTRGGGRSRGGGDTGFQRRPSLPHCCTRPARWTPSSVGPGRAGTDDGQRVRCTAASQHPSFQRAPSRRGISNPPPQVCQGRPRRCHSPRGSGKAASCYLGCFSSPRAPCLWLETTHQVPGSSQQSLLSSKVTHK